MDKKIIYGIQQIGVGVDNADKSFEWYAKNLGADVAVFDDNNVATYMAPYMGGEPHEKRAILAMNLQGGSGYEIWQYIDRTPAAPKEPIELGDLGINIAIIKSKDIEKSYERLKGKGVNIISDIKEEPDTYRSFYIRDPNDSILKIKEFENWYQDNGKDLGGTYSCVIGVSDIDTSMRLYADVLGYDVVIYDKTESFADLSDLPRGKEQFRRVLLGHKPGRQGGFAKLLGESQIELIECKDSTPRKIFADRYWGDIGFIHLCFDVRHMKALVQECADKGFPFKVLSDETFQMGEANGHWGYIEDPDGTLIEFVETHKVPLIKALNFNIHLKNRDPRKPLPNWLIKAMRFKRVKFKD